MFNCYGLIGFQADGFIDITIATLANLIFDLVIFKNFIPSLT